MEGVFVTVCVCIVVQNCWIVNMSLDVCMYACMYVRLCLCLYLCVCFV